MSALPIHVHSHHKCATRWQIAYLERVAALNGLTFALEDSPFSLKSKGADIMYFGNSSFTAAANGGLFGPHVIRNPLSIIESAYWSHLNSHPADEGSQLARQRALLRSIDADAGRYLTHTFLSNGALTPLGALQSWKYADPRFPTIRMEDLVQGPAAIFGGLVAAGSFPDLRLPPDEEFAFERFSGGRKVGQVAGDAHYRSGSPDSWKALPHPIVEYVLIHLRDAMAFYPEVRQALATEPASR